MARYPSINVMRGCHEARITLLEVMLALAIFALAATAVFRLPAVR